MLAARTGSVEAVKELLGHGAPVNAAELRTGTTALMWAAMEDRAEATRALIGAGADLNARSRVTEYPHTPPGVIGDKVEEGASYVGQTVLPKGGWTALMYAVRQGSLRAATVLAESGADLDATDPDGTSALTFAIVNGHYEVAAMLADKGANLNLADRAGMTPLYAAVDMHTMPTTFGRPDLKPPVVAGSVEAIRMLLAHGADPNARLKAKIIKRVYNPGDPRLGEGATPFMRAAKGGDTAVMQILLQAGADPKLTQKNANSPIVLAAGMASTRAGNNPDHGTEEGAIDAIRLCLDLGLDINAPNATGDTAVHAALGSPTVIAFLAQHGARLDVKNKQGRTPLAVALRAREVNVKSVALLRQLTGDNTTQAAPGPEKEE
jgi:ankyrin repeat protein